MSGLSATLLPSQPFLLLLSFHKPIKQIKKKLKKKKNNQEKPPCHKTQSEDITRKLIGIHKLLVTPSLINILTD